LRGICGLAVLGWVQLLEATKKTRHIDDDLVRILASQFSIWATGLPNRDRLIEQFVAKWSKQSDPSNSQLAMCLITN
jgi:hypothetical protein